MNQTPEQFIAAAREGLALQTQAHSATWHLGEEEHWSADLDAGQLVFHFADGVEATTPIQVVGTYNQNNGSFLWGWDHPSIPEPLRQHAYLARQWGEEHQVVHLTERLVTCSEDEAWDFAALTNRLANANGVYRGPADTALVFMTLGEITLRKPET